MSECGDDDRVGRGGIHSPHLCGGEVPLPAASDSPASTSPLCPSPTTTPTPPSAPQPPEPAHQASVARHVPPRPDRLHHHSHHRLHHHHPPPLSLATHHDSPDSDDPDEDSDLQSRVLHDQTVSLQPEDDSELSPSAHVNYKDEPLSVSVVHDDSHLDSQDSGLLSPSELSPREGQVSVPSMIDATDFRSLQQEPMYQNLSSMNGRMSPPGFSPSSASSYATLTPLQPLPPISTVSDKFAYGHTGNVSGSFTLMQNNGIGGNMLSMGSPYQYDKLSMSPPHYTSNNSLGITLGHQHSPLSPHSYPNGLASPQKSLSPNGYDSPYTRQDMNRTTLAATQSPTLSPPVSLHSPPQAFSTFSAIPTSTPTTTSLNMNGLSGSSGLGSLSPQAVSPHSPNYSPHHNLHIPPSPPPIKQEPSLHSASLGCHLVTTMPAINNQSPPHVQMAVSMPQHAVVPSGAMAAVPSLSGNQGLMKTESMATTSGGMGGGEVEEINTKELAQRISAELKRYSIPQAIFAQRVLCRSQGTLSDLLRNPKPWSKLKSGRETFRRMWKWLQEPEFQRMSALRLAASMMQKSQGKGNDSGSEKDDFDAFPFPLNQNSFDTQQFMPQGIEMGANGSDRNGVHTGYLDGQGPDNSTAVQQHLADEAYYTKIMTPELPSDNLDKYNAGFQACKRKEDQQNHQEQQPAPKKPRLVFTDLQRRTLQAIFKETKRPSKEMQVTIARQLGLEPSTVGNFFMNARRRSMDKWKDDNDPGTNINKMQNTGFNNQPTNNTNTVVHMTQMQQMQQNTTMVGHCLDDQDL